MLEREDMQDDGYMIVLKPALVLRMFEAKPRIQQYRKEYQDFRKAFAQLDPAHYRGISRDPINAYQPVDLQGQELPDNATAKRKMHELLSPWLDAEEYDPNRDTDLLETKEDAYAVHALLERPADYEIIRVRRSRFSASQHHMGFDIGYWGGDHFSLIADTVVTPTWHAPPEDEYHDLAERLSALNRHLLFENEREADEFRKYYKSRPWAETEMVEGEFCIIQVEAVEMNAF